MLDTIRQSIQTYIEGLCLEELGRNIVTRLVSFFGIILVTILLVKALHWIVNHLMRRKKKTHKRLNTLRKLINSVITYALSIVAFVHVMQSAFSVNLGAIVAAAGILGVAVGFGAQTLIKDVIAGFFILLEGQYSVGDEITVSDFSGTVDELGLRSTRVRAPNGDLFIIPNGAITNLVNHSLLPHSFFISYIFPPETDSNMILDLFGAIGRDAQEDLSLNKAPAPSICPAHEGEGYSIRLKVTCQPDAQEALEKEFTHRLHKGLAKAGVRIPEADFEIIRD